MGEHRRMMGDWRSSREARFGVPEGPATRASWSDAVHLEIEVVALRIEAGVLKARLVRGWRGPNEHPDEAAMRLAKAQVAPGVVSHSTSWRFDDGKVVVTYAVLPDPCVELVAPPVGPIAVVSSGSLAHPTPKQLEQHHVVAHAICHLAHLREHDPGVARAATLVPELWSAVAAAAARASTQAHDQIHAALGSPVFDSDSAAEQVPPGAAFRRASHARSRVAT